MLLSGFGTVDTFYNNSIIECKGEIKYRHGKVEYNDETEIPCNSCPTGSKY